MLARFLGSVSVYGTLLMGPTMYLWVRFANTMYPSRSLASSFSKGLCEQLVYDPISIVLFMYVMTVAEGRTTKDARNEV